MHVLWTACRNQVRIYYYIEIPALLFYYSFSLQELEWSTRMGEFVEGIFIRLRVAQGQSSSDTLDSEQQTSVHWDIFSPLDFWNPPFDRTLIKWALFSKSFPSM